MLDKILQCFGDKTIEELLNRRIADPSIKQVHSLTKLQEMWVYKYMCSIQERGYRQMKSLRKLLRCDTIEECRHVQTGNLFVRRFMKFSGLFLLAITLIINDIIGIGIDRVYTTFETMRGQYEQAVETVEQTRKQYESVTNSVLYRWTFGWFYPPVPTRPYGGLPREAPELDSRAILIYRAANAIQFFFFLMWIIWCLRWAYADSRVRETSHRFYRFVMLLLVWNTLLYVALKVALSKFI